MKICNNCNQLKEDSEFSPAKKANWRGLSAYCKECKRLYDKDYWTKNKNKLAQRKKENKQNICNRNINFIVDYLKTHPCIDCNEPNIVVLEFDHVKEIKVGNISEMVCNGVSLLTLQNEINKCEVRCANCHRIKTAKERNFRILNCL